LNGLCLVWSHGVFIIIYKPDYPQAKPWNLGIHMGWRLKTIHNYTIKINDVRAYWNINKLYICMFKVIFICFCFNIIKLHIYVYRFNIKSIKICAYNDISIYYITMILVGNIFPIICNHLLVHTIWLVQKPRCSLLLYRIRKLKLKTKKYNKGNNIIMMVTISQSKYS